MDLNYYNNGVPLQQNQLNGGHFPNQPIRYPQKQTLDIFSQIRCSICAERFTSVRDVNRHKIDHSRRKFTCGICLKHFTYVRLQQHLIMDHNKSHSEIYKENNLNQRLNQSIDDNNVRNRPMEDDDEDDNEVEAYVLCHYCDKNLPIQRNFLKGFAHDLDNVEFKCLECNLTNRKKYKHKTPNLDMLQIIKCDNCGEVHQSLEEVHMHLIQRHTHQNFECGSCNLVFYDLEVLRLHNLEEHQSCSSRYSDQFMCNLCGVGFSNIAVLNEHNFTFHTVRE